MADINQVKKAAVATSPELTDKVIFYFVDHGMQILTAIVLMGIGVFIARWVGNLIHRWLKSKAYDEPVSNLIVKVVKLLIIAFIGRAFFASGSSGSAAASVSTRLSSSSRGRRSGSGK